MEDRGSYSVALYADGTVAFDGSPGLPLSSICLSGRHFGRIPRKEAEGIRQAFLDAGYFDFKDAYLSQPVFDQGGAETSFQMAGRAKTVWRYFADPSAPKVLEDLEKRLDDLVRPRWRAYGTSWLSVHQNSDGSWTRDGLSKQCDPEDRPGCADGQTNPALTAPVTTALCLLPLSAINRSHAPLAGRGNVSTEAGRKGIAFLIAQGTTIDSAAGRNDDVRIFIRAWLCTALCAHALHGAAPRLAQSLVDAIQKEQQEDGSWPAPAELPSGKETATAWAALALRVAARAGVVVDQRRLTGAATFLRSRAEILISELSREPQQRSRIAEALRVAAMAHSARMWAGSDTAPEGDVLRDHLRTAVISHEVASELDPGDLFFCMKAYQYLEEFKRVWELWRIVEDRKCSSGCRSGSWDPQGWWGYRGGRLYMTSLMVLCEVTFYRVPSVLGRE
jgi:hypothetical protein